jgi:hypothetical protein
MIQLVLVSRWYVTVWSQQTQPSVATPQVLLLNRPLADSFQ